MAITINGTTGISGVDGSAATPAFKGSDSNTGISFGTDTVTINTGGVARVTTDASGNVGIGTVSPRAAANYSSLGINGTTGGFVDIFSNTTRVATLIASDTVASLNSVTSIPLTFGTANTEKMRIDSSGNVGIGTSSPIGRLNVSQPSTNTANYYDGASLTITNSSATANNFDSLRFTTANGNDAAAIWTILNSHTASAATGTLVFGTSNAAAASTERMRIDSSGNLLVGRTSAASENAKVSIYGSGIFNLFSERETTASTSHFRFANPNGVVGSIQTSASSTSYVTSSDYRLKENVTPMTGALATVAQLKPCTYTWKADGSAGQGFIAHELQSVVPDCVTGTKDAVDAEGKPQYQGVDTSFLVATLVSAIQEQQAIITKLQADVAALKGAA